ncbi:MULTISPECIES: hypothetical protein [Priestia]|uniref:hypothetical protein n=1 Tax=Priestia TaxID=2800373 RepID=UPI00112C0D51|nr:MULTISPECIES: hypothetical protein [Priestia]TPF16798.1 hypothetical protein CBE78_11025 [Priestia megaterium]TPF24226.1 hypothetical protein CBE79_15605 [Priestia megaterium]
MKKYLFLFSLAVMLFVLHSNIQAHALTFNQLPNTQSSDQWTVEIDKVKSNDPHAIKSKKGVYQTYSMAIKSIKNDASDVRIELFRDEENSTSKYGIVHSERETLNRDDKEPFYFANFPLSEKAKKLEVVITWKEKGSDRNYQERFTFSQN